MEPEKIFTAVSIAETRLKKNKFLPPLRHMIFLMVLCTVIVDFYEAILNKAGAGAGAKIV